MMRMGKSVIACNRDDRYPFFSTSTIFLQLVGQLAPFAERVGKAAAKIVGHILESPRGTALVPIPKRSASPRVTSTLQRWVA